MVAARSEGGGVEVDSGSMTMTKSLRKRSAAACSEVRVEVAACSGPGDKAPTFSRAEIKDCRLWRQCGGFQGDSRARESVRSKIC
jgi:hypothetical protein